jgi:hypothetical protein
MRMPQLPPEPSFSMSSKRLRAIGAAIIVVGLVGGAIFYVVNAASASKPLDDMSALGYERARQHQMGIMMGHAGQIMMQWMDDFERPWVQAILIAIGFAIVSAFFFRAAWVVDEEERDRKGRDSG